MKTISDEDGRLWLVDKGDPAWELLGRLGRPDVVLPKETIIHATVPHPKRVEQHATRLGTGFAATNDPSVREAFLRAVTLFDCLVGLQPDVV